MFYLGIIFQNTSIEPRRKLSTYKNPKGFFQHNKHTSVPLLLVTYIAHKTLVYDVKNIKNSFSEK